MYWGLFYRGWGLPNAEVTPLPRGVQCKISLRPERVQGREGSPGQTNSSAEEEDSSSRSAEEREEHSPNRRGMSHGTDAATTSARKGGRCVRWRSAAPLSSRQRWALTADPNNPQTRTRHRQRAPREKHKPNPTPNPIARAHARNKPQHIDP